MKIAYIAAGAGGMYCGSCLHDNTLAAALQRAGHEVALLPTYTPMKTDEDSVASDRIFYGAINVYLQQKSRIFRKTPRFLDRLLDRPGLIDWVARKASRTDARDLGDLTNSVLLGEDGRQKKELDRLTAWLRDDFQPDIVHLTNSLFLGMARTLARELDVPVVVNVQGEDLFLDQLPERHRTAALAELRRHAEDATVFVAPNRYYAGHMATTLEIPEHKMRVLPLGIQLDGYHPRPARKGAAPVLGYLARICPEKGFDRLIQAFIDLDRRGRSDLTLRVAGYLMPQDRSFLDRQMEILRAADLEDRVEVVGEVDRAEKLRFLHSLDLLAVPTAYREAKGLFAIESLAAGVPVVLPDHGGFPELIEETRGGRLFRAGSTEHLADVLHELLADPDELARLGEAGRNAVFESRDAESMASATLDLYEDLLAPARDRALA